MIIYGKNPVLEALQTNLKIKEIIILESIKENLKEQIEKKTKNKNIKITYTDKKQLDILSKNGNHQGLLIKAQDYEYYEYQDLLKDIRKNKEQNKKSLILMLDGIEDPHNLGAIIRSGLGADADAIIIGKNRSASVNETVLKTSAGAVLKSKIVQVTNLTHTIKELKQEGLWIYGLDFDGEIYNNTDLSGDVCIVVGSEGKGISRLVKENCDFILTIPINKNLESLNASVAAAIVMFEVQRQRG